MNCMSARKTRIAGHRRLFPPPACTRLYLAAALMAFSFFVALADPLEPEAEFVWRSERAEYKSVKELLNKPKKIDVVLEAWPHDDARAIRLETDMHAIYPFPVGLFVEELLNYENMKNTFPRMDESYLEYESEDPFGKHTLWAHIKVNFLGFGAEYPYVLDNWMERSDGGYLLKYRLNRSPDGTLYQLLGSWYLEEVMFDGEPHTYIRNYAIIGIQKGNLAIELAMRAFGVWELKQVFRNIAKAVKKRANTP